MSPESLAIITKAIDEVNKKVITEAEMDGIEKGRKEGMKKGREDTAKQIAKKLKNHLDIPKISEATGLSIEEIENL